MKVLTIHCDEVAGDVTSIEWELDFRSLNAIAQAKVLVDAIEALLKMEDRLLSRMELEVENVAGTRH